MVKCPGWAMAMLHNNLPRFANIQPYAGAGRGPERHHQVRARARWAARSPGTRSKRYRDRWKRPLVLKGLLHPEDAEKAVSLGADGIVVSNHGGRQIEALPPPIDCVPAIVKAVGNRATVLFDSGVRSGTDVARALALGADAALRRQGVPVGPRRARRRRAGPCDRSLDRRIALGARPDRRAIRRPRRATSWSGTPARCTSDLRPRRWRIATGRPVERAPCRFSCPAGSCRCR